jgi:trigger factor
VICGRPIYEYDHIWGWAKVKRHIASEITLLCDNHHREKTARFLPNQKVIEANERPFNIVNGVTAPHALHYSGSSFMLALGTSKFWGVDQGSGVACDVLRIDGEPLLGVRLEDGHFLLNLCVRDSKGDLVLLIEDNELLLNVRSWDIEIVGAQITIREGKGNILFDIIFRTPSNVVVVRGRFLHNGVELLVAPKWWALLNERWLSQGSVISDCSVGLSVGHDPAPPGLIGISFPQVRREGWDRESAVRWARATAEQSSSLARVAVDELLDTDEL